MIKSRLQKRCFGCEERTRVNLVLASDSFSCCCLNRWRNSRKSVLPYFVSELDDSATQRNESPRCKETSDLRMFVQIAIQLCVVIWRNVTMQCCVTSKLPAGARYRQSNWCVVRELGNGGMRASMVVTSEHTSRARGASHERYVGPRSNRKHGNAIIRST